MILRSVSAVDNDQVSVNMLLSCFRWMALMKLICSPITSGDILSINLGFVSLIDERICMTFRPREEFLLHVYMDFKMPHSVRVYQILKVYANLCFQMIY